MSTNKPVSVKDLRDKLDELVEKGKGDYPIFLTNDEECNGYHGCWYLPTVADECDESEAADLYSLNDDAIVLEDDKNKAVYLG